MWIPSSNPLKTSKAKVNKIAAIADPTIEPRPPIKMIISKLKVKKKVKT